LTPYAFVVDETGYLLPTLYGWDAESIQRWSIVTPYPSYFYFWIYSFLPHDSLNASKILNAAFIVATAVPIYAIARRYLAIPVAAAFTAVVILSPISSFARYVMPESVYFFGFWMVVLVVLSALDKSELLSATAGGALIGALSLIKPHALALTLGIGLFFLLRDRSRIHGALNAAVIFLGYYVVRVVLAYLLIGEWTWSVIGPRYAEELDAGYRIDFLAAAYNLLGHVSAIVALVAVPLAVTLVAVSCRQLVHTEKTEREAIDRLRDLGLLACGMLAAMVAMTVYYSQSIYQIDPEGERITRLHGRYYVYVLPLFVLVTIGLWQNKIDFSKLLPRWVVAITCGAVVVAAVVVCVAFETNKVDYPDLALADGRYFAITLPIAAFLFVGYGLATRAGTTKLVIGATLWWPAIALSTSVALIAYFAIVYKLKDPVDIAFFNSQSDLRRLVGRNDGIVVGSDDLEVWRMMFYLRSLSTGRIVPPGTEFDTEFSNRARWAIILPEVRYIGSLQVTRLGSVSIVWK
jgi:phosphoglycerol transferase